MDTRLALMCGSDIPVPECKLVLHQPTIKEISLIGETSFLVGVQTICIKKEMLMDETLLEGITNFQIFMTIMSEKETADKKQDVLNVLLLLLPKAKVTFTPQSILIIDNGENVILDNSNFEIFQNAISMICCLKNGLTDSSEFNPANEAARKIAKKMMENRKKIAQEKGDEVGSIFTTFLSVLTVGIPSMSLFDLMNSTIFQLDDLMERYSLYANWDLDIRARMTGGGGESEPENWMKNIH